MSAGGVHVTKITNHPPGKLRGQSSIHNPTNFVQLISDIHCVFLFFRMSVVHNKERKWEITVVIISQR